MGRVDVFRYSAIAEDSELKLADRQRRHPAGERQRRVGRLFVLFFRQIHRLHGERNAFFRQHDKGGHGVRAEKFTVGIKLGDRLRHRRFLGVKGNIHHCRGEAKINLLAKVLGRRGFRCRELLQDDVIYLLPTRELSRIG